MFGYTVLGMGGFTHGGGPMTATGGSVTDVGIYKVHSFVSSADFVVSRAGEIDLLMVGGGGS